MSNTSNNIICLPTAKPTFNKKAIKPSLSSAALEHDAKAIIALYQQQTRTKHQEEIQQLKREIACMFQGKPLHPRRRQYLDLLLTRSLSLALHDASSLRRSLQQSLQELANLGF